MEFIYFVAGFLTFGLISSIVKAKYIVDSFKGIESNFLLGSMYLIQFKYQAIQILQLAYEEAADINPKYKEEEKIVIAKIHEKFAQFGDDWINALKARLPYETEYNNWNEAIQYTERLINRNKFRK